MIRKLAIGLAAVSMAFVAIPANAQEQEAPRTTYRVEYIKLKDGSGQRWDELGQKYFGPAADAAGLERPTVHWLMAGPWDIMMIFKLPRGLASLDTHANPEREAWYKEFVKIAGSEEAAKKITSEVEEIEVNSVQTFSHTHP